MRTFFIIWLGQLISLLGSSITGFALGIWVYERNGSVTQFAMISLAAQLPGILLSPVVGALVDRWNRRLTMMISDTGAFLATLTLFILLQAGMLEVWHIIVLTTWASICGSFQSLAYNTAVTVLMPREQFGRASGLMQLAFSLCQLLSPLLGGLLMVTIGLNGIIMLDMSSYGVALFMLFLMRIPDVPKKSQVQPNLKAEVAQGWAYLKERRELVVLLSYFSAVNFFLSMGLTSFLPMVLGLASKPVAGSLLSVCGLGTLVGSLLMSSWGGPKRRIYGIYAFHALSGLGLLLAGVSPNLIIVGIGAFLFSMAMPLAGGCSQAIWLSRTEPEVQGRVFALRRMFSWGLIPLAYLVVGPLSDHFFEPLMMPEGWLGQGLIGSLIGNGQGRGIALLLICLGLMGLILPLIATRFAATRKLDEPVTS